MQYLIAHMLRGEAGHHLRKLSEDLARLHRLEPVTSRIAPHLTLKAPFDTDDIAPVEQVLEAFAGREQPQPYTLGGFGEFKGRVIFMAIWAPKQTHMLTRRLQDQLRAVPWMTFRKTEFPLTLHATLAYPKTREQCKEILSSLKREHPTFECSLNTIALLRKPGAQWELVREYTLQ